jgi:cathepsin B
MKNGIKFENSNFRSYGSLYYVIGAKFVTNIVQIMKLDLLTYGPFTVTFTVYEDFLGYKSGVYKHMYGNELFSHSVEIIGYGENYWIGKNSWGLSFGENGFFKIVMGTNECNIESQFYAGFPKIK